MALKRFPQFTAILAPLFALTACAGALRDEIYQADPAPPPVAALTRHPPQTVRVRTSDGLTLTGHYWPGDPADRDILLFFHGRGSNAGIAARYAEHLTGRGDHVLVVTYRGFGGNPGAPTQAGLIADGRAFVARAPDLAGPDARIFLVGHSLGGAVALHVAATDPVAGVITLSAFDRLAKSAPPAMRGLLPDAWDNVAALKQLRSPLVMIHGAADRRVDMEQAAALFAAAPAPVLWLTARGAGHHPNMARLGPLIGQAVKAIDSGAIADLAAAVPDGWSVRRK